MLSSLRIENYAIVSFLELDFSNGMTAFTGETGAGKSIMIDALMLALGERADASVLRSGAEKCEITASFFVDAQHAPAAWLAQHDLELEAGELLLRRIIYKEGRSKSYINGQPFPLQKVKELSTLLVDIHGQHQHQTLLHHATHRQQLDQYAKHGHLLAELERCYQACQMTERALSEHKNQGELATQLALLQEQLLELDALALKDGEMADLNAEHQRLHHAKDYLQQAQQVTELLNAEDQVNVCKLLHQIIQSLTACPAEDKHVQTAMELINTALIHCGEALNEMTHFADKVLIDPLRLQTIEERIGVLYQCARKYHIEVSQLSVFAQSLQEKQAALMDFEENERALKKVYAAQLQAYDEAALALRQSRKTHATKLAAEITTFIQKLGMPQGFITLAITPLEHRQAHGMDKVEYQVCTNKGMPLDSLSVVASGGELSRIGLAIHVITAQRGATPTLVFDEVDVGIGGATAALVGQLLRRLGQRLQLFCVTHQAQVASAADQHFRVEKYSDEQQTFSRVTPLNAAQKIDEIARMLGGLTITEQTRSHAQELLLQSHEEALQLI